MLYSSELIRRTVLFLFYYYYLFMNVLRIREDPRNVLCLSVGAWDRTKKPAAPARRAWKGSRRRWWRPWWRSWTSPPSAPWPPPPPPSAPAPVTSSPFSPLSTSSYPSLSSPSSLFFFPNFPISFSSFFQDTAPSGDLLRPLLPPNPYLTTLKLDCSRLDDSAIAFLLKPSLHDLSLHNCADFSGRLLSEIGNRCKDLRFPLSHVPHRSLSQ